MVRGGEVVRNTSVLEGSGGAVRVLRGTGLGRCVRSAGGV